MALYLQYGCGLSAPEGWLNFDASPSLRLRRLPVVGKAISKVPFPDAVRFGDICKGLPIADGSADGVYCSHVLEHLPLEDVRTALRNTYRVLRSGGTFRLVLPDLRALAERYVASDQQDAALDFVGRMLMGQKSRRRGLVGLMKNWLGNEDHRWMWDYESLSAELKATGFTHIRRASFNDNPEPMWQRVEWDVRWNGELGIECVKP